MPVFFFSLAGFGGIVLQVVTLNVTLALTDYDSNLDVLAQPALVETGLRALFSLVPAAAAGLGILALVLYPLHGERLTQVRRTAESLASS